MKILCLFLAPTLPPVVHNGEHYNCGRCGQRSVVWGGGRRHVNPKPVLKEIMDWFIHDDNCTECDRECE